MLTRKTNVETAIFRRFLPVVAHQRLCKTPIAHTRVVTLLLPHSWELLDRVGEPEVLTESYDCSRISNFINMQVCRLFYFAIDGEMGP